MAPAAARRLINCRIIVYYFVSNFIVTDKRTNTRDVSPVFTRQQVALNPHEMTPFLLIPNKSVQLLNL